MPPISFSGLASGIDTDAIIKATTDARRLATQPLQNRLDNNKKETTALEEFTTKLLTVNDKAQAFRVLGGSAIAKNATSSNDTAVTATAGANASATSTTLTVESLAKAGSISFADDFSSADAPIAPGLSGTAELRISVGSGTGAETKAIPVTNTTTLNGLVTAIQAASPKLLANGINVGTAGAPHFKLLVASNRTGTENGAITVSPDAALAATGLFGNGTVQAASDAVVNISGLGPVRRPTNQISDIIPGVTLDLKRDATGPVTISVANSAEKTSAAVGDLVTSLNDVITYSSENSAITRKDDANGGVSNVFGTLARTNVDNEAVNALRRAISDSNSGVEGSTVRIFADIGVSTQRDGSITFDAGKFQEALSTDPTAVESLLQSFSERVGSVNGVISQYTKFQGLIETAKTANTDENTRITTKLGRLEDDITRQTASLKQLFANLESTVSRLNASGNSLAGLIGSGAGTTR